MGKVGVRQVPQALAPVRLLLVRSGHHVVFYLFIACEKGFGVSVDSCVSVGLVAFTPGSLARNQHSCSGKRVCSAKILLYLF